MTSTLDAVVDQPNERHRDARYLEEHDNVAYAWLVQSLQQCKSALDFRLLYSRLARHFAEPKACQIARHTFLYRTLTQTDDPSLITALYRGAELSEQQSILRSLADLPKPADLCALAVEACRTNAIPVFAAIALNNRFPARYFSDAAFCQLVIKTLFLGLHAPSILDLQQRATLELRNMVEGYAQERRAAGRDLSADLTFVLSLCPSEKTHDAAL